MSKYLDELRAAAEAEFAANNQVEEAQAEPTTEPVAAPEEEPPTPEQEPPPQPEAEVEEEEPPVPEEVEKPSRRTIYTKVVDLGDGSPPQVFKASTKDELIDKILTAQLNASKRIKELKKENRDLQQKVQPDPAKPSRTVEPRQLTADEELEVANELQTNPTGAIAKALKAVLGRDPEDIRRVLAEADAIKERETVREIGQKFIAGNPEYPINVRNEKLMGEYIQKNNLAWTVKNLELAFADLVDAGLIVLPREAEAKDEPPVLVDSRKNELAAPTVTPAVNATPVVPARSDAALVEVPRRKKMVVGISSSQGGASSEPEVQRELSVEDLLKVLPSERRRIVLRQAGQ